MMVRFSLLFGLLLLALSSSPTVGSLSPRSIPVYSIELESELREELFRSYNIMQRPQQLVVARTSLNLLSLNYLDIKEQKLSITAYFYFNWPDTRLKWIDNSTYNNVRFLFSSERDVWRPAIIVENSVDEIDVISKPFVPMRILGSGLIAWMPAGIFITHCESTITYWPLDSQTCKIILSSWSYTANEVALEFDDPAIVLKFYQESGEWELTGHTHETATTIREFERFSRLIFTLKFRRRPIFHMLNTLFPVVVMGFLTVAVFKLSPESGERVGLSLTILLAYAVYLGLISESIPQTSVSTSLLSTYLASILFLQALSVLLTVIYLDIYLTPAEKEVPKWVQRVAASCCSKLAFVECCRKSSRISAESRENTTDQNNGTIKVEACDANKKEVWVDESNEEATVDRRFTWKEIALMLDKITMYIYLILVTGFTVASLTIMCLHFTTAY